MSEEMLEEVVEEEPKKKRTRAGKNVITGRINDSAFNEYISELSKESMVNIDEIATILAKTIEQAYLEWSYPGLFRDKNATDEEKSAVRAKVVLTDKSFKIYDIKKVTEEDDIEDDALQISLEDAQEIHKRAKLGEDIEIPFDVKTLDKKFVRRVKQLFQSHLKDASKQAMLKIYQDQIGELIEGTVIKVDTDMRGRTSYEVSFGKASGFLRGKDLMSTDRFNQNDRVTVYLDSVDDKSNPISLKINRSSNKFLVKLLERNILEIQNGDVKIVAVAREAGIRSKVFVYSENPNIDAVGACIGTESGRINSVLSVIKPEKVDVLPYHANKALQVIDALTPAKVIGLDCPEDFFDPNVHYDELEKENAYEFPKIAAIVQNGDQGIAIGSKGANVRLASRLSKTTISIHTADEAIQNNIHYQMLTEIQNLASAMTIQQNAMKDDSVIAPADDIVADEVIDEAVVDTAEDAVVEPVETVAEPTIVEEKVVEPVEEVKVEVVEKPQKKEEVIEHIEIKNKPKISLEALEQALSQKKGPSETKSYKKKYKNDQPAHEEKPSIAAQQEALPIYTQEELDEFDENDNYDDRYYDEYEDLDEYDSDRYYDDETK